MPYLMNISVIVPTPSEDRFIIWVKNKHEFTNLAVFRVMGSTQEGQSTFCIQKELETVQELQHESISVQEFMKQSLKKDFNEELFFFLSALEKI